MAEQGLLEYLNRDVTTQIKEYIAMGGISELLEVGMEKKSLKCLQNESLQEGFLTKYLRTGKTVEGNTESHYTEKNVT